MFKKAFFATSLLGNALFATTIVFVVGAWCGSEAKESAIAKLTPENAA